MSENYIAINCNFDIQSGFAFPSTSFVDNGIPIVRMSDLKSGRLRFANAKYVEETWLNLAPQFLLKPGDFLIGMSGSLSNYATVRDDNLPALLNQRVGRLRPKTDRANYKYVCYWLKSVSYASYAEIQGEGAAQKNISAKQIGQFKYRDISLLEQKYIVGILETIDQSIEKTEALIKKYQQIKAGLIHDLFTRGMTADGHLRPTREQAPELYKETPIGWVPKTWEISSISDLAHDSKGSTVIGPFGSDLVMTDYRSEGVPIIFVRDVKEDKFNWVSNIFVSKNKAQSLYAHRVNGGDILVTKMGLPPCISSIYPDSMPMGIITADMIRMTPNISKIKADWLSSAINYDRTKRQVAAITAGVTRSKVTLKDFRTLKIAVPAPAEQGMVMQLINNQKRLIEIEKSRLIKLNKQKAGLMHDLLTGKVPVKIDEAEVANV